MEQKKQSRQTVTGEKRNEGKKGSARSRHWGKVWFGKEKTRAGFVTWSAMETSL